MTILYNHNTAGGNEDLIYGRKLYLQDVKNGIKLAKISEICIKSQNSLPIECLLLPYSI